jgi:hypothetical protein
MDYTKEFKRLKLSNISRSRGNSWIAPTTLIVVRLIRFRFQQRESDRVSDTGTIA